MSPAEIIKSLHKGKPRALTADEAAVLVRDGTPDEITDAYLSMSIETPADICKQLQEAMKARRAA